MLAFGGGHIAGAMNIGPRAELSIWAGWMLDPEQPIFLVLPKDTDLPEVQRQLHPRRVHEVRRLSCSAGWTSGTTPALPLERLPQMTVHEVKERAGDVQVVDVRSPEEWEDGHVPGREVHLPARAGEEGRAAGQEASPSPCTATAATGPASGRACSRRTGSPTCATCPAVGRRGRRPAAGREAGRGQEGVGHRPLNATATGDPTMTRTALAAFALALATPGLAFAAAAGHRPARLPRARRGRRTSSGRSSACCRWRRSTSRTSRSGRPPPTPGSRGWSGKLVRPAAHRVARSTTRTSSRRWTGR